MGTFWVKIRNPDDNKERGMVWIASLLKRPSETQLIGDSMICVGYNADGYDPVGYQRSQIVFRYSSFSTASHAAVGLRHLEKANVCWFDGHVTNSLASELRGGINYANHFGRPGGIYQKY